MSCAAPGRTPDVPEYEPSYAEKQQPVTMSRYDILGIEDAVEKIIRFIDSIELMPTRHDWYVGITGSADERLYEEHKAQHNTSIYVPVDSADTARAAKKLLMERYGMDGGPDEGDYPRYVYAFKKTADSDPPL
jgi:hypothetical protein